MKKNLFVVLAVMVSVVSIVSCKKGDTGPAGTAGATGPAGPQGPAGSANVIYSNWTATNPWVASTTSTGSGKQTFYFDITASGVTQPILDNGTVLVYAKFVGDPDGAGIVKLLPSIYYNVGGAATQYRFQHGLFLNKVRVICDVIPAGSPSTANMVRYVILPGGVAAGRSVRSVDYSDYHAVCRYYNIPE